jgi:SHAQKYF class myb-like DNA-binding protein
MFSNNAGRWSKDEHNLFVELLAVHGRDWTSISKHLPRSPIQVRSHAQKYFKKQNAFALKEKKAAVALIDLFYANF